MTIDEQVPIEDDRENFGGFIGSCIDISENIDAIMLILKEKEHEIKRLRSMLPICSSCKKIRGEMDIGTKSKLI